MSRFTVAEIQNWTSAEKSKRVAPKTTFEWVQIADIGADYVAGSIGKIKVIKEYNNENLLITTTTFKYQDTLNPEKVTEMLVV